MPDTVQSPEVLFNLSGIVSGLRDKRVTPLVPQGYKTGVSLSEEDTPIKIGRDGSSGWSVWIRYVNAKGEASERRITCQKLSGYGQIDTVSAYCHESRRPKMFRVDCMLEMIDLVTGEQVDPGQHLFALHQKGLMGLKDKALDDFASVLVFLAKCDGEYHPFEEEAMVEALSRYCVRFGGDDCVVNEMVDRLDAIAPDARDMLASLGRLTKSTKGPQFARLIMRSASDVIDADFRTSPEELEWGAFLQRRLLQLSVADR